jgi:hypothetical protein
MTDQITPLNFNTIKYAQVNYQRNNIKLPNAHNSKCASEMTSAILNTCGIIPVIATVKAGTDSYDCT